MNQSIMSVADLQREVDNDEAYQSDMRELRKQQLRDNISPEEAEEEMLEREEREGYDDDFEPDDDIEDSECDDYEEFNDYDLDLGESQ